MDFDKMTTERTVDQRRIWAILVTYAGAIDRDSKWVEFRQWLDGALKTRGYHEFRLQGALGFGGKLRVYPDRIFVDCYSEDETPARKAIIERTNAALAEATK